MTTEFAKNPDVKMMYLIRRKPSASREELVAHWFANHMPLVVAAQKKQAEKGRLHAKKYIATLFDADKTGDHAWDGVAQLWFERQPPKPDGPIGSQPTDTFQQKAEPYTPWATTEYVVMDGSDRIPVEPLTLNEPFPTTRSGFFKVTFLVGVKPNTDYSAFFHHWLTKHLANVRNVMEQVGGYRYTINHGVDPANDPFAGMAELYFPNADGWRQYTQTIKPDGMEEWVDNEPTTLLYAHTEMIGIPG
jgi:hypothetical protein